MTNLKSSFTEGPLFFKITKFALPIMITGILQMLYNMADNIVVGKFSSDAYALGAVGSAGPMTNLTINLLLGISVGVGVMVAQGIGAKQDGVVRRSVHTGMLTALIGGILFMCIGLLVSRPAFELLDINENFINDTTLYFRIICLGIPANAIYNFAAAILRSAGDSKTPLFILSSAGIVNVIFNLIFVIGFDMTVEGVAIATIISQYISAVVIVIILMTNKNENIRLSFKELRIDRAILGRMLRLGIPTGIQSAMFNISNVLFVSGVNSLAPETITANTIAGSIDGITYIAINSLSQTVVTFVGQNYGARRIDRVKKSYLYCIIQGVIVGLAVAGIELLLSGQLINLFMPDNTANMDKSLIISEATAVMFTILPVYFLTAFMDVTAGAIRALGASVSPMIISIFGICVLRVLWILFIFPLDSFHTIVGIYLAYPVTWTVTALILIGELIYMFSKLSKRTKTELNKESITE